jgi:hypothetical protein
MRDVFWVVDCVPYAKSAALLERRPSESQRLRVSSLERVLELELALERVPRVCVARKR